MGCSTAGVVGNYCIDVPYTDYIPVIVDVVLSCMPAKHKAVLLNLALGGMTETRGEKGADPIADTVVHSMPNKKDVWLMIAHLVEGAMNADPGKHVMGMRKAVLEASLSNGKLYAASILVSILTCNNHVTVSIAMLKMVGRANTRLDNMHSVPELCDTEGPLVFDVVLLMSRETGGMGKCTSIAGLHIICNEHMINGG